MHSTCHRSSSAEKQLVSVASSYRTKLPAQKPARPEFYVTGQHGWQPQASTGSDRIFASIERRPIPLSDLVESGGCSQQSHQEVASNQLADGAVKVAPDNPLLGINSEMHLGGGSRGRSHRGF